MSNNAVNVDVKVTGVDEAIKKAERLRELLKEAKKLADELASYELELDV